jgi:hypothetical protein
MSFCTKIGVKTSCPLISYFCIYTQAQLSLIMYLDSWPPSLALILSFILFFIEVIKETTSLK